MISNYFLITCSDERFKHYAGLDFIEKIDCVDTVNNPPSATAAKYGLEIALIDHKGYFGESPGGVGCFLSHYALWQRIAALPVTKNFFCILEDDACPNSIVTLYNREFNYSVDIEKPSAIKLNRRSNEGTEGYLINQAACKRFIEICAGKIILPVDQFLWTTNRHTIFKNKGKPIHDVNVLRNDSVICLASWSKETTLKKR